MLPEICHDCGAATDKEVAELYNRMEQLTAEITALRAEREDLQRTLRLFKYLAAMSLGEYGRAPMTLEKGESLKV